jgi:hypothetical protein
MDIMIYTGPPHIKQTIKQLRHSSYTLEKVLNEMIDNVLKIATKIDIILSIDDNNKLDEIKISDNYKSGFLNINKSGSLNPFNLGHVSHLHDDDDQTSEFGIGLKAAAINAGNLLEVYSRIDDKYFLVTCDFKRMENEPDVNKSYNPSLIEITKESYMINHIYEYGSSIKITKIRHTIYPTTTEEKIIEHITRHIQETYSLYIKNGLNIILNNHNIQPISDYFDDTSCKPFIIKKYLIILENDNYQKEIFSIKDENSVYKMVFKEEVKQEKSSFEEIGKLLNDNYKYYCPISDKYHYCLTIETTFTKFSNNTPINDTTANDTVDIYKNNRKYGNISLFKMVNGVHNYTKHRIQFNSKKIGKELGITFNKEINLLNSNNNLSNVIKFILRQHRRSISADISTDNNKSLCERAIEYKIIDPYTCDISILSKYHQSYYKRINNEQIYEQKEEQINDQKVKLLNEKRLNYLIIKKKN